MALETVFAGIGIIILIGFLGEFVFSKTQIPDVLWLILIGMILGPVFHIVRPDELQGAASIFTTFALLFILFEGGLHIRVRDLMKSMYGATIITISNFVLATLAITAIAKFFGFDWGTAALLGTILAGTSSAVVVPVVRRLNMGKENSLVLVLESAFSDVLCIVASLTIMQILTIKAVDFGVVLQSVFGSFAIAIFLGSIIGLAWILLLDRVPTLSKSYMSTIGVLLIIFGLTEFARSSGAIAGLAFGIMLGNSRKILSYTEGEDTDTLTASARIFFSQISFFVKTFFFVYIGILIAFADFRLIILGLLITGIAFIIRPIPVRLAWKKSDIPTDKSVMESIVPKGLAAAVLAQLALETGIPGARMIQTPVFTTILFSIIITTIMLFFVRHGKKGKAIVIPEKQNGHTPPKKLHSSRKKRPFAKHKLAILKTLTRR
jgi:potassium/hydrogen antiporter